MHSSGQDKAIAQLKRIESASDTGFRVVKVYAQTEDSSYLFILVEINCSNIKSSTDGLQLKSREKFVLRVRDNFPFSYPTVYVSHNRFNGFSHVQWVRHLCLYLSPLTEWNISDGMYGYIERLHQWLVRGAKNSHELDGQPLHPPAVYPGSKDLPSVIIRNDTPSFEGPFWLGFAVMENINEKRVDLVGWQQGLQKPVSGFLSPVILLSENFPFEYPNKAEDLFKQIELLGVKTETVHALSLFSSLVNNNETPLYLIVGSPMRGIKHQKTFQHLSVWSIDELTKNAIGMEIQCADLLTKKVDDEFTANVKKLSIECKEQSMSALKSADMRWCSVQEDRSEVTIRRDNNTSANAYSNKAIALWGCGALGSYIAEILVRSGATHLILRDNKKVTPGILVRQNYEDADIGNWKCDSLKNRLLRINPKVTIETDNDDISSSFNTLAELSEDESNPYDLIIDATASNFVHLSLEEYLKGVTPNVALASVIIGAKASSALFSYFPSVKSGAISDALRKSKIKALKTKNMGNYAKEFWPNQADFLNFQPEPGCSDPTFIGSSIDMMILVGRVMDLLGKSLVSAKSSSTHMLSKNPSEDKDFFLEHSEDLIVDLPDNYQVRFDRKVIKDIYKVISKSKRSGKKVCETGGLLFGQIDHASEIVWITEIMGPPKDSISLPEKFVCGTKGTKEFNSQSSIKTQGSVHYIGMWHTHPVSSAVPSFIDMQGMAGIMCNDGFAAESQMLLIIGHSSKNPEFGIYQFSTSDIQSINSGELEMKFKHNGTIVKEKK
ncbi:MAG: ThiF family adenylyltransferase [Colwellia sp.]|nr:ThiF family adenylyltransferase [Colwellia sp.]